MDWRYSRNKIALRSLVETRLPETLRPVFDFVERVHAHDMRIQEGQLVHLYRCFLILFDSLQVRDEDMLAAAFLHDVVEDTPVTLDEVEQLTNKHVREMVDACTSPNEEVDHTDFLKKIKESRPDAQLVKLVDRLDNCRSMQIIHLSHQAFVERYAQKTVDFFLPIAKNISGFIYQALEEETSKILGGSHG